MVYKANKANNWALGVKMNNQNLYVAHFVIVYEDIWHRFGTEEIIKQITRYGIQSQLYKANNIEEAYSVAAEMVDGLSDVNHDGEGDLWKIYCIGINHLEEVSTSNQQLDEQISDLYGIDCGLILIEDLFDKNQKPRVKTRNELLRI